MLIEKHFNTLSYGAMQRGLGGFPHKRHSTRRVQRLFKTLAQRAVQEAIAFLILAGIVTGCSQANLLEAQNALEKRNIKEQAAKVTDTTFYPARSSRNWHAWIDRVAENEPRLIISGEVDLPTPGYKVEWRSEILDHLSSNGNRQPPAQRISISFIPPDGMVTQVITPTKVSFTMPSLPLEYSSVMIYCGDKLLADIPDVVPTD